MNLFWAMQPTSVRFLLICICGVVLVSTVRLLRLGMRLYQYGRKEIAPETICNGGVDADLLAKYALENPRLCTNLLERCRNNFSDRSAGEKLPYVLRLAESRFAYLWERHHADVKASKRASLLTILLSVVMVSYGAVPIYDEFSNNGKITGLTSLILTIEQLLLLFSLGSSLCAMLYLGSSVFERTLENRRTSWNYVRARLQEELSDWHLN